MKLLCPGYMNKFSCLADKCRHSCCLGWEIGIDEDTLSIYDEISGDLGEKLKAGISRSEDGAAFILTEDERCPFLLENGLCELICEKGEDILCDICREHPRFYNDYEDFSETGLGMTCEEAARLILTEDFSADDEDIEITDPDFAADYEKRKEIFRLLEDGSLTFAEKFRRLEEDYTCGGNIGILKDNSALADKLFSLERMDGEWDRYISLLKKTENGDFPGNSAFSAEFSRLTEYFVYRWYLSCYADNCLSDYNPDEIMNFVLTGVYIIITLFSLSPGKKEDLIEICRIYSSEIEYSDENPPELCRC